MIPVTKSLIKNKCYIIVDVPSTTPRHYTQKNILKHGTIEYRKGPFRVLEDFIINEGWEYLLPSYDILIETPMTDKIGTNAAAMVDAIQDKRVFEITEDEYLIYKIK